MNSLGFPVYSSEFQQRQALESFPWCATFTMLKVSLDFTGRIVYYYGTNTKYLQLANDETLRVYRP